MSIMDELSVVGGIFGSALSQLPVVGAIGDYLVDRRQSDIWGGVGDDAGLLAQHSGPQGRVDYPGLIGGLLGTPGMQDFGQLLMRDQHDQQFRSGERRLDRQHQTDLQTDLQQNRFNFQAGENRLNRQNQAAMNQARINAQNKTTVKSEMLGKAYNIHDSIASGGRAYAAIGTIVDRFTNDGWEWGGAGSGFYNGAYESLIPELAKLIDPDGAVTDGAMAGAREMLPHPNQMKGWDKTKMQHHWETVGKSIRARTAAKAQQAKFMAQAVPEMMPLFEPHTQTLGNMEMGWDTIDQFASPQAIELQAAAQEKAIRRMQGTPQGGRMAR